MNGVELIAAERKRQINKEGWTPAHDDEHDADDLAIVAACYALPTDLRMKQIWNSTLIEMLWPGWEWSWFKPSPRKRIRDLVKAGALIAAEIDRLQRAKAKS